MKQSSPSWKKRLLVGFVFFLFLFFHTEILNFTFFHDRGLWEQVGWRSYEDEDIKRVKFLLWLGADPSYVHDDGHGPTSVLENAVEWQNLEIIEILLPLLPAESHSSAMEYACRRGGHDKAIEFLSERGITPSKVVEPINPKTPMPTVCLEVS
ncbi:MAG: hypothetical protein WBS20_02535, partial [Lysobacterales bacterium]